jgi:hypothetical protein
LEGQPEFRTGKQSSARNGIDGINDSCMIDICMLQLWEAFQEKLLLQVAANLQPQECEHA